MAATPGAEAWFRQAEQLLAGTGGQAKDERQAFALFKKAADDGHLGAQKKVAACYSRGRGTVQDHRRAAEYMRRAADQNDGAAQLAMGEFYADGLGVQQNDASAARRFRAAANLGNVEATYRLGQCYETGRGVVQGNKKAFDLYVEAAHLARRGHVRTYCALGAMYTHGNDAVKADLAEGVRWYTKAADPHGDPDAFFALARAYEFGHGVEQDTARALNLYKQAAGKSHVVAMRKLATAYVHGHDLGVDQNIEEALVWYKKLAKKHDPEALNDLGVLYVQGLASNGVPDGANAIVHFKKAANLGHVPAMRNLARCYDEGLGGAIPIRPSPAMAAEWYGKAAAHKDAMATAWIAARDPSLGAKRPPAGPADDGPVVVPAHGAIETPGGLGVSKGRRIELPDTLPETVGGVVAPAPPAVAPTQPPTQVPTQRAEPTEPLMRPAEPTEPPTQPFVRTMEPPTQPPMQPLMRPEGSTEAPTQSPARLAEAPPIFLTGPPSDWTIDQVVLWLQQQQLAVLEPVFRDGEIDGRALVGLNDHLAGSMPITLGARSKLLMSLQTVRDAEARHQAPPPAPTPPMPASSISNAAPPKPDSFCVCS